MDSFEKLCFINQEKKREIKGGTSMSFLIFTLKRIRSVSMLDLLMLSGNKGNLVVKLVKKWQYTIIGETRLQ